MKAYLKNIALQLQATSNSIRLTKANRVTTIIPRAFIKVGSLIAFTYLGKEYTAYVISTKRTSTGLYISSRRNLLVTCLVVDLTEVSTQITLSRIYKKGKLSSYSTIKQKSSQLEDAVSTYFKDIAKKNKLTIDFALFGKQNFRTFKVKNIRYLNNLKLSFNTEDQDG